MTIIDIENMTAAELKAKRDEAVTAIGSGGDTMGVATRYVQARLDAKLRDEKLAEQGATINSLNAAVEALTGQVATEKKRADGNYAAWVEARQEHEKEVNHLKSEIAASQQDAANFRANADAQAKEITRLDALAKSRRAALADVMTFAGQLNAKVAPLLAE